MLVRILITDAIWSSDSKKDARKHGQDDLRDYFKTQLFIARLHHTLRLELMKNRKDTWV
jgi:hypothetical protein